MCLYRLAFRKNKTNLLVLLCRSLEITKTVANECQKNVKYFSVKHTFVAFEYIFYIFFFAFLQIQIRNCIHNVQCRGNSYEDMYPNFMPPTQLGMNAKKSCDRKRNTDRNDPAALNKFESANL